MRGIPTPAIATYIGLMRRSLASRIAALAIAVLAGISSPGLAFLHGYAHDDTSDVANHDREHHRAASPEAADESHDELIASFRVAKMSKDHDHPQVARALSVRMDARLFALPPIPVAVPRGIVFVGTASLLPTASPARVGPADAPTRQPRAPPLS